MEKYIVLLRGINVGGNCKVEMKKLKKVLEDSGYKNVTTYINSGNVILESKKSLAVLEKEIFAILKKTFGFDIPVLVKTALVIKKIAKAIPEEWKNDDEYKTDVAYLFPEIDFVKTIEKLPIKKEYLEIRYQKGAIFWRVSRKDYHKSQLNKLASNSMYKLMTIRNVNTARHLANY